MGVTCSITRAVENRALRLYGRTKPHGQGRYSNDNRWEHHHDMVTICPNSNGGQRFHRMIGGCGEKIRQIHKQDLAIEEEFHKLNETRNLPEIRKLTISSKLHFFNWVQSRLQRTITVFTTYSRINSFEIVANAI